MTLLRTIASHPFLSLLASISIYALVVVLRSLVGVGYDIPHHEPNVGDE